MVVSRDTFYHYLEAKEQAGIDADGKVAFAKLYPINTRITSTDLLDDTVLPFFVEHEMLVLRILIDLGTEFFGRVGPHEYQLYHAIKDIEYSITKAVSPQTNGTR